MVGLIGYLKKIYYKKNPMLILLTRFHVNRNNSDRERHRYFIFYLVSMELIELIEPPFVQYFTLLIFVPRFPVDEK